MITAIEYTRKLGDALRVAVFQTDLYSGKEGCLRLAREYGRGLADYPEKEALEALRASYGLICVIGYNMKPPIDAKEWVNEVEKSRKQKASVAV